MRFGFDFGQVGVETEVKLTHPFAFWEENGVDQNVLPGDHSFTAITNGKIEPFRDLGAFEKRMHIDRQPVGLSVVILEDLLG